MSMYPFVLPLIFVLATIIPKTLSVFSEYQTCLFPFQCGEIKAGYPFWGVYRPVFCGHPNLELECEKVLQNQTATLIINDVKYIVLSIEEETQTLRISRADYQDGLCPREFINATLVSPLSHCSSEYKMITFLYGCPVPPAGMIPLSSCLYDQDTFVKEGAHGPGDCHFSVVLPIKRFFVTRMMTLSNLQQALREGFKVKWNLNGMNCEDCVKSNGSCGYDVKKNRTVCHCLNQQFGLNTTCPPASSGERNWTPVVKGLGIAAGFFALVLFGVMAFLITQRCKRRRVTTGFMSKDFEPLHSSKNTNCTTTTTTSETSMEFSKSISSYGISKSDIGRSNYFGAQVFSSAELEKATSNFDSSKKLGDGGFGSVYHGVLKNGLEVAVKRLYEHSSKRVHQFMIEVEILAHLRHPNLVTLYGCTSRHSRELLIVYEYIPNGTLGDHLSGRRSNSSLLTWPTRLSIAIEMAEALAYLHASDVIHRDIKTNNVLLDNEFHVKVADLGLSRLFPNDVTHVSTAPQGTLGYVDPEYYQCYKLTDKSDVYSFGVVLMELISSLPAVDTERIRQDINLSNMATTKIQNHRLHELVDPSLGFETDYTIRNMITSVAELAFRCLQQDREIRPSMQEVVEVLRVIQNTDNI